MKDFRNEYRQKLRSPEEAVAVVKTVTGLIIRVVLESRFF